MEFLVTLRLDRDRLPAEQDDLFESERGVARELKASGVIVRMWAVPEGTHTISIWSASGLEEAHAAVTSLPLSKWMDINIIELALHYLEATP